MPRLSHSSRWLWRISPGPRPFWVTRFYGEELLALRPTHNLEDHHLSAVRDCFFNIFAATLHMWGSFLLPQPEDAPWRGGRDPLSSLQCNALTCHLAKHK
jgi:hypothetical protein